MKPHFGHAAKQVCIPDQVRDRLFRKVLGGGRKLSYESYALPTKVTFPLASVAVEMMEDTMRKIALALAVCLISSAPAFATCKSDAGDKKLAGAALKSFMTKCEKDAKTTC